MKSFCATTSAKLSERARNRAGRRAFLNLASCTYLPGPFFLWRMTIMLSPPTRSEPPAERGGKKWTGWARRPGRGPILTQEAIGRQQPEIGVPRELFVLVHKVQLLVRVGQLVALAVALGRGHGRRRRGRTREEREAEGRAGAGWPTRVGRRREGRGGGGGRAPGFYTPHPPTTGGGGRAKRRRVGFLSRAGQGAADTRATVLPRPWQGGGP